MPETDCVGAVLTLPTTNQVPFGAVKDRHNRLAGMLQACRSDAKHVSVVNLGLGAAVTPEMFRSAVDRLRSVEFRRELTTRALSLDLLEGPDRILHEIFGEFERRERKRARES